jgi:hypothetical protein
MHNPASQESEDREGEEQQCTRNEKEQRREEGVQEVRNVEKNKKENKKYKICRK